jgi:hypothetical protein
VVTVLQFSRGVGRTLRAIEREARRAERQRLLIEKARAKQALLDASAAAADEYEHVVDVLTNAHRIQFERKDWAVIADQVAPIDPPPDSSRERVAAAAVDAYRPGWFARTFGLADRHRCRLVAAVETARAEDIAAHERALAEVAKLRNSIEFAQSLIKLRPDAILSAVQQHANLKTAAVESVSVLSIATRVIGVVGSLDVDDMPNQAVNLLQSGKASVKALSASKRLELHRDNVCSSAIRIAAELLRVVPVESVEVLMHSDLLDSATGHISPQPIFYARVAAQALSAMNLSRADPFPLAERLGGHFTWNRKSGFQPIKLQEFSLPPELQAS